jgi:hypothetical protein
MTGALQPALELRDIHLPPPPPFWPPAPGWWVLAALLLVLLAWAGRVLWKRQGLRRQRRLVLDTLAHLEEGLASEPTPEALAEVSALLRRLALTRFPREQVAVLSGVAWLDFLDQSGGRGRFANGPGRVLASGPYRRSLPADLDAAGLSALVREWVHTNLRSVA